MKTFGQYFGAEAIKEKTVRCRTCDTPLKAITDEYLWFECGNVSSKEWAERGPEKHLNPVGWTALPCERYTYLVDRHMADHGHHFHGMRTFIEWQKEQENAHRT